MRTPTVRRTVGLAVSLLLLAPFLGACGGSSNSTPPPEGDTVTSVSPPDGSMSGGYRAQVKGSGFSAGVTRVLFGQAEATDVSVSGDTTLNLTVPAARSAGSVDVSVTTSAGTGTLADGFFYNYPPQVWFVAPPAGPAGLNVSVAGIGFSSHDAGTPTVMFGTEPGIGPQVVSDTLIFVTTPLFASGGVVDVSVTNLNGTGTLENGYLVLGTFAKTVALLLPRADAPDATAEDPGARQFAIVADLQAKVATGYVLTAETGGRWDAWVEGLVEGPVADEGR